MKLFVIVIYKMSILKTDGNFYKHGLLFTLHRTVLSLWAIDVLKLTARGQHSADPSPRGGKYERCAVCDSHEQQQRTHVIKVNSFISGKLAQQ